MFERLYCKMVENEYEKLALLQFYYTEFSEHAEKQSSDSDFPISSDQQCVQHISFIVGTLYQKGDAQLREHLQRLFALERVKEVLNSWVQSLGDEEVCGSDLRTVIPALVLTLP